MRTSRTRTRLFSNTTLTFLGATLTGSCDKRGLLPVTAIKRITPRPVARNILIDIASPDHSNLPHLTDELLLSRKTQTPITARHSALVTSDPTSTDWGTPQSWLD